MSTYIFIGIILLIAGFVIYIKYFKKEPEEIEEVEPEKPTDPLPEEPEQPEPPVEPEPPKEPKPPKKEIVEVGISEGDNTDGLREQFHKDNTTYKLPKDARVFATGVLESDIPNAAGFRLGGYGIIRIDGRKNIEIDGQNATLWNEVGAVPMFSPEGERYDPNSLTMSKRKFLRVDNSELVWIHDLNVESGNLTPTSKPNRPAYHEMWEFEHGIDVNNSQKVALENFYTKGMWGDGTYIVDSKDVYFRNVTIDWNGRQGGALISGQRGYLERYKVLNSRRSGFDIEGNTKNNDSDGFVITYSEFSQHLAGLPMGGPGFVKNVLIINNTYNNGTVYCEGNGKNKLRENIMFVNSKGRSLGDYFHTNNILVDGIEQDGIQNNNLVMSKFINCKNITVRNCDMPSYGFRWKGDEPFFLLGAKGTPISEFKIYGNKQTIGVVNYDVSVRVDQVEVGKWYFKPDMRTNTDFDALDPETRAGYYEIFKPIRQATETDLIGGGSLEDLAYVHPIEFPEYIPTPEEAVSIPFETNNEWIDMQWKRLYGKSWRPELYEDDGWRPDWYKELK